MELAAVSTGREGALLAGSPSADTVSSLNSASLGSSTGAIRPAPTKQLVVQDGCSGCF